MITCYRNQLKHVISKGVDPGLVFVAWAMSHEDITRDDLIDIYKEETGEPPS